MAVAAKYSKKPSVSVEEVESDSSLGVDDDNEVEPGDDMDIDIKEEVNDSEEEDSMLLNSFIPDDSFPEIKEDDDKENIDSKDETEEDSDEELLTSDDYGDDDDDADDTGIKSEEMTDSENADIKDSDTDKQKPKKKDRKAPKEKSEKRVRIMAESSDGSESEKSDDEADDTKGKEGTDEEDIKSGLADVITKILSSSGKKDKLLSKAKKDFLIKKEDTGSEFEFVDGEGKVKNEVKIKVEDEVEQEDIQKLAHKKHIEKEEFVRKFRVKPNFQSDREKERKLRMIATQGVVQLFTAIEKHKAMVKKHKSEGQPSVTKETLSASDLKETFLNILDEEGEKLKRTHTGNIKKEVKDEPIHIVTGAKKPKWNVFADNFYKEPTLQGWDLKSDEEE